MRFGQITVERQGSEIVMARDGMTIGDTSQLASADLVRACRFFRWYWRHTRRHTVAVCEDHTTRWMAKWATGRVSENVWSINQGESK